MSYLAVAPDMLAAAATNVESIGSALTAANTAVASSTSAVTAAGADEVSTAIASLFSQHGAAYQQVSEDMAAKADESWVSTIRRVTSSSS